MLGFLNDAAIRVNFLERVRQPLRCPGLVLHCGGNGCMARGLLLVFTFCLIQGHNLDLMTTGVWL